MAPSGGRRVLLLGDDIRMVLPIARSLGRKGVEIHLAWVSPGSPARASRFAHRIHELPAPTKNDHGWIGPLQGLLRDVHFDLVLPTTEPVVLAVQSRREELEPLARIHLLEEDLFRVAFDKSAMQQIAGKVGLPFPPVRVVRAPDEVDQFFDDHTGAVVVKPGHSVSCEGGDKQFVRILNNRSEVHREVAGLLESGQQSVLLQSCFNGSGVGVEFLAENGRILTAFQHRRLHETTGHGSTHRIGEAVDAELRDATGRLLAAMNYTGVGMCEFRRNSTTGEWIFIELNPRFWGSLPLACASGADFPWYLFQFLLDNVREFPERFRTGVRCRSLTPDLRWMNRAWRRQGLGENGLSEQSQGWGLNDVPRGQIAAAALRLLLLRDRIDSLTLDDPGPFLRETLQLLKRPFRRCRQWFAHRSEREQKAPAQVLESATTRVVHRELVP